MATLADLIAVAVARVALRVERNGHAPILPRQPRAVSRKPSSRNRKVKQ